MPKLIAEFKRESPWDGPLTDERLEDVVARYDEDPDVWAVSIVVDARWGGFMDDIDRALEVTTKPILAKASFELAGSARERGAYFELTRSIEEAKLDPGVRWLEVHRPSELPTDKADMPLVVVANNRNIETGELVPQQANAINLAVPDSGTLVCAASGYESLVDVPERFDFALIGTALLR